MVIDYKINESLIVRTFRRSDAYITLINDLQDMTQQVFTNIRTNNLNLLEEIRSTEHYDDISVCFDSETETMLIVMHSIYTLVETEPGFFVPDWWAR